mgnify:CR=1 FL=1
MAHRIRQRFGVQSRARNTWRKSEVEHTAADAPIRYYAKASVVSEGLSGAGLFGVGKTDDAFDEAVSVGCGHLERAL